MFVLQKLMIYGELIVINSRLKRFSFDLCTELARSLAYMNKKKIMQLAILSIRFWGK
jgi:hypothetical protein